MDPKRNDDPTKRGPKPKPRGRLTGKKSQMEYAADKRRVLEAITNSKSGMSVTDACKKFNVPEGTARTLQYGDLLPENMERARRGEPVRKGRGPYLTESETAQVLNHMSVLVGKGAIVSNATVQTLAHSYSQKDNPPSRKWAQRFMKANVDLLKGAGGQALSLQVYPMSTRE